MNYTRFFKPKMLALILGLSSISISAVEPEIPAGFLSRYFDKATSWAVNSFFVTKSTVDSSYNSVKQNISRLWINAGRLYSRIRKADEVLAQAKKDITIARENHISAERRNAAQLTEQTNRLPYFNDEVSKQNKVLADVVAALNTNKTTLHRVVESTRTNALQHRENTERIKKISALLENLEKKALEREKTLEVMSTTFNKENEQFQNLLHEQQENAQTFQKIRAIVYARMGKEVPPLMPVGLNPLASHNSTMLPSYIKANRTIKPHNHIEEIDN